MPDPPGADALATRVAQGAPPQGPTDRGTAPVQRSRGWKMAFLSVCLFCLSTTTLSAFRPGSRAWLVTFHGHPAKVNRTVTTLPSTSTSTTSSILEDYQVNYLRGSAGRQLADGAPEARSYGHLHGLLWLQRCMLATALASCFYLMMPVPAAAQGGGRGSDFSYRIPPSWGPEDENHYSFRAWMTDISLWVMVTDLLPHQQCATIIMRLKGQARELARMITPQEVAQGGMRGGVQLDPVSYLLGALQLRFANLDEESRLQSMTELLAFTRFGGENINAVLARYEVVRQRAASEGRFVMSIEGCALQIMRAVGVHPNQLTILLNQFGGRLPNTEQEYQQLVTQLRRQGHIAEAAPGNVAHILQGPFRQARRGQYFANDGSQNEGNYFTDGDLGGDDQQAFLTGGESSSSAPPIAPWASGLWDANGRNMAAQSDQDPYSWDGHAPAPSLYPTSPSYFEGYDSETSDSSATSSDSGNEELDMPNLTHMSQDEAAAHVYASFVNRSGSGDALPVAPCASFDGPSSAILARGVRGTAKARGEDGRAKEVKLSCLLTKTFPFSSRAEEKASVPTPAVKALDAARIQRIATGKQ